MPLEPPPAAPTPTSTPTPTPPAPTPPDAATRASRNAALALTLALVALGLAWELWLAPTGRGTLAVKVLPLLFAVPGLLRFRLHTFRWLSLLVWLYAMEGSVRLFDPGLSGVLSAIYLLLALALFGACGWHIRHRLRKARAAGLLQEVPDGPEAARRAWGADGRPR